MNGGGWFGALGTRKTAKRAGWRRLVYGRGNEAGLYATLATPGHGAVQVEVLPPDREGEAPSVRVRLTRYAGVGPEEPQTLLEASLG